ncbi:potassium-transporting ATPase subunit KdpC [Rudaea sp.]|uniref:potassium-transporting ATPase subunit KdpC n=1 Tax=Rudaea sp. TaxID=2136325 RepID=UPI002ECFEDDE
MSNLLRPALSLLLMLTVVSGVLYPLAVTGVAQAIFPNQANGSLIERDGKAIGSELIGQLFTDPKYFWSRPSATAPFADNSASSGGSNQGPTNQALTDTVKQRIDALHAADPGNPAPIPTDLVTTSGSGLDPDISPAAARYQLARVARARGRGEAEIAAFIEQASAGRQFGVLGESRVNVLRLNLLLDSAASAK